MSNEQLDLHLFRTQLKRETEMREKGLERLKDRLQASKEKATYSQSPGGSKVLQAFLPEVIKLVDGMFQRSRINIESPDEDQKNEALLLNELIGVKKLTKTGQISKTHDGDERTFDVWDSEQVALITLQTMLDHCRLPMAGDESERKLRPSLAQTQKMIGQRIQHQLLMNYLRGQKGDGFVDALKAAAYKPWTGTKQKHTNTAKTVESWAESTAEEIKVIEAKLKAGGLSRSQTNRLKSRLRKLKVNRDLLLWSPWKNDAIRTLGAKMMRAVGKAFEVVGGVPFFRYFNDKDIDKQNYLALTQAGIDQLDALDALEIPTFWEAPMVCVPREHSTKKHGGYLDTTTVHDSPRHDTHKGHIDLSDEHLDYLNNLQSVPMKINTRILEVMEQLMALEKHDERCVGKFQPLPNASFTDVVIPPEWDVADEFTLSEDEYNAMREEAKRDATDLHHEVRRLTRVSRQLRTNEMVALAQADRHTPAIYLPTYSDFRGRTYYRVQSLNPQAMDPGKALLLFAEGYTPETQEDEDRREQWIIFEMAGNLGYDKMSWADRRKATMEHIDDIVASVADPIGTEFWKKADKPWLLLAAAQEYVRLYIQKDANRTSYLRVSVDATCSGQQCHAGWLRNLQTAEMVNLTPVEQPADVYMAVHDKAVEILPDEVPLPHDKVMDAAKLQGLKSQDYGHRQILRKGAKAQVMVAQYSAGVERQTIDWRAALKMPWLAEGIEDKKEAAKASRFNEQEATKLFKLGFTPALEQTLPALVGFIEFCKGVAKATITHPHPDNPLHYEVNKGEDGKWMNTVKFETAAGSVIHQHYRESRNRGIDLDHLESGKIQRTIEKEMKDYPRVDKHITSIAANFTHGAGDGAVLILGPGQLLKLGIPLTSTHDSVAGRPGPEMDLIVNSLKSGFKKVVTSDTLERFVQINGLSLEDHPVPRESSDSSNYWDPDLIDGADYAFC